MGLFIDPFAKLFGGQTGKAFSESMALKFGDLYGWRDWHRCWMAVRTKAIDDSIMDFAKSIGNAKFQMVNLGAGLDTRAFRLECLASCSVCFEVDMSEVLK